MSETNNPTADTYTEPFTLQRVPIESDGYDPNGTYYGVGEPVYWLASEDGRVDRKFRAKNDDEARAQAISWYGNIKLPKRVESISVRVNGVEIDGFTFSYLVCALWISVDDEDRPLDSTYSVDDLDVDTIKIAKRDCEKFQEDHKAALDEAYQHPSYTDERAGHDFWLTRNHHGVGFWDRDLGDVGEALTKAANAYGERNLYVGDDGKIYIDS